MAHRTLLNQMVNNKVVYNYNRTISGLQDALVAIKNRMGISDNSRFRLITCCPEATVPYA